MQASKLSTTVDWAVDKCHFCGLPGTKQCFLGLVGVAQPTYSQALPVDNSSDFRASPVAA